MDILDDAFPNALTNFDQEGEDDIPLSMDSEAFKNYEKLLKNAKEELYPDCKDFSTDSYYAVGAWFDYFLGIFKKMLLKDNCLP